MFSSNRDRRIEEELYKLKYRQKALTKMAVGYKKQESAYYKKAKKSLVKGDERSAATYARQSVQFSDMALSTNNMACRIEIIESNIRRAIQTGRLSDQMITMTGLLTSALEPMSSVAKIGKIDRAFEDIMVSAAGIADALDASAAPVSGATDRERTLMNMMQEEIAVDDIASMPMFAAMGSLGAIKSPGTAVDTVNYF